ncbi:hypothetical protein [Reichenbachiella sp. 5M10]|uniref:hypothetical protein n=1 Tax=Reichenbachiella sp. 5M10 TaxID=1889772 RepID=UPI00117B9CCA|nr:hypothetical protein [Reichenbachiella sp. 5M10]
MKSLFVILVTTAILAGCSNEDAENPNVLNIRLSNESQYDYHTVVVNTTTGDVDFGDLLAGQKSAYKVFDRAYRYAFVELQIEGETYTLQPIDYVGETPLETGSYTYQIDVNDTGDRYAGLRLTLVEE